MCWASQRAYARDDGTPGWEALEEIVGGLEGGSSVAFASGMAGIAAVFDQLPSRREWWRCPMTATKASAGLANAGQSRGRWSVRRIAVADTAGWIQACAESDLIWLESPSNPLLAVADLETICAAPRKPGAILGVDNTFATPLEPASAGTRRRRRGGVGDEVHRRALGPARRRRHGAGPGAAGRVAAGAGIGRRDTRHAGDVSRRPGRANAGRAAGARAAERHGPGGAPGRSSGGR